MTFSPADGLSKKNITLLKSQEGTIPLGWDLHVKPYEQESGKESLELCLCFVVTSYNSHHRSSLITTVTNLISALGIGCMLTSLTSNGAIKKHLQMQC